MENTETTETPNQEPVVQPQPSNEHPPRLTAEQIAKRKKSFFRKMKLLAAAGAAFIIFLILAYFAKETYNRNKDSFLVNPDLPPSESGSTVIIVDPEEQQEDTHETFSNENYRFSFVYPKEDKLNVTNKPDQPFSAQIVSSDVVPVTGADGLNLVKGYFFEVKPVAIAARDLAKVAQVKQDYFRETCPSSADIGNIVGTKISNIEGLTFEISNCNSDYIISYLPANNLIYEVIQTFKGDLGFKQNYKLRTNLMVASLKINEKAPTLDPLVNYEPAALNLRFSYPRELDTQCCTVPEPDVSNLYHMLTLSTGNPDETVGFFFTFFSQSVGFDHIANNFENALIDDYQVIKSRKPDGTKTEFEINGMRAIKLEGYSWKENDITLVDVGDSKIMFVSDKGFPDEILQQIYSTLGKK